MNRLQFHVLNTTSFVLVVLIIVQFWMDRGIQGLNNQILQTQAAINHSQQIEPVLQKISIRIAQNADKEPRLRDLLVKYRMKVTLTVDGKQKSYP